MDFVIDYPRLRTNAIRWKQCYKEGAQCYKDVTSRAVDYKIPCDQSCLIHLHNNQDTFGQLIKYKSSRDLQ